ncbi:hypothetical protein H5410_063478 [Solanum commersonii]|uniref:Uncharacterized protein n=1 Tax=Solanum commersonii TaxID=4109 RepID=A0A9J5WFF2_SOLCO|nr:hypothetical protein H5410_063478 [Solanum commersonii]
MNQKNRRKAAANTKLLCHTKIITSVMRNVVINITVMQASPEKRNICPLCFEVWTILTRGKQPSELHCLTIENVAVMIDWLPTMAARVAITKTGQYTPSAWIA